MLLIRTAAKFLSGLLVSGSFSVDVRRFDQGSPFLDLALDKFFGDIRATCAGRNQNGARTLSGAALSLERSSQQQ
jgi:hypothetical protein